MLAIDASHWQQQLDIPLLKKEGVDLAIIKASQGQLKDVAFTKHAKAVQDGGMMLATYIWVDPIIPTDLHVSNYESVIKGFSPQFVALDLEQWWNSWERWQKWRAKLIPQIGRPRYSRVQAFDPRQRAVRKAQGAWSQGVYLLFQGVYRRVHARSILDKRHPKLGCLVSIFQDQHHHVGTDARSRCL